MWTQTGIDEKLKLQLPQFLAKAPDVGACPTPSTVTLPGSSFESAFGALRFRRRIRAKISPTFRKRCFQATFLRGCAAG